ncbi:MAG: preprotein translocase subunit SecE [Clostridia bacterium]|nr:preprotein translocase subunit SecE [Clostridia bacterium]
MADLEKKTEQEAAPVKEDAKKSAPKKDKVPLKDRIVKFFRDYKAELKKIVWCSPKQTLNNSVLVFAVIIVLGAVIALLDFGFGKAIMALGSL